LNGLSPQQEPSAGFELPNFDLSSLKDFSLDNFAEDFKSAPTLAKGGLAVAAIGGASFLLFSEVEAIMQIVGTFAAGEFVLFSLLY
jgi:hypothetical protein